jgi:hypothetical protein
VPVRDGQAAVGIDEGLISGFGQEPSLAFLLDCGHWFRAQLQSIH